MTTNDGGPAEDRNALSYWYPIVASVVPTPRTILINAEGCDLLQLLDGKSPAGYDKFLDRLGAAADQIGYPCFLRTDHGSGKHRWRSTCFVDSAYCIRSRVAGLVEWSESVGIIGLSYCRWVVRELLPVESPFTAFSGMPIARERRYFVYSGPVVCHHPYWPPEAIKNPSCQDWRDRLERLSYESDAEIQHLGMQSIQAVNAITAGGGWSVDWLWVPDVGWYLTDMALAAESWHWPGCPNAPAEVKEKRGVPVELVKREDTK